MKRLQSSLGDEQLRAVLHHVQTITTLATLIQIECQSSIVDIKFKSPVINQKAKRIQSDSQDIVNGFNSLVRVIDEDHMQYEHSIQLHRLYKWFSVMKTEQIEEFLDKVEAEIPTIDDTITYLK